MIVLDVYREEVQEKCLPGFTYTGDTITIGYDGWEGEVIERVFHVIKGKRTPKFEVRGCGDHYIKANYRTFDWIDKKTHEIIRNVKDE